MNKRWPPLSEYGGLHVETDRWPTGFHPLRLQPHPGNDENTPSLTKLEAKFKETIGENVASVMTTN